MLGDKGPFKGQRGLKPANQRHNYPNGYGGRLDALNRSLLTGLAAVARLSLAELGRRV